MPRPLRMTRRRLLPGPVGRPGDSNGALGRSKGLVAGQKGKALGLVAQKHGAQVAVAQADLAVLGHGAGDAERLQADADGLGSLGSRLNTLRMAMAAPTV